jgi:type IV secretory pathway VirB10-like protein
MKTNFKKVFIILGVFLLIVISIITTIILLQQNKKEEKRIVTKTKLPKGYFDPREINIVKMEKPQEDKPKPQENKPQEQKENFISNLVGTQEVDYQELLRNKINYERLHNQKSSLIAKKEEIKEPNNHKYDPKKEIDPYLYDKDFGIEKDVASRRVKLERVITADKNFSAILMTAVNSLLPGKVVAMIENNIYGSQGRQILIPKGSTAIGTYQPIKKIGEERLAIQWVRILTPFGVNINLTNSLSADQMGRSGTVGDLDNRYMARYGLPLAITTVANALSYAAMQGTNATATNTTTNGSTTTTSLKNEVIRDYKNDVGRVSDQVLKQQLNIKPVINIKSGTRIFISPILDIWFPEVKNNKIDVQINEEKKQ